jgi:hypothetical protein
LAGGQVAVPDERRPVAKVRHVSETAAVHQMIRQTRAGTDQPVTHDVGDAQEWWCPECGRRLLLSFPPAYQRVVLEVGDVWTPHAAGSGAVTVAPITPAAERPQAWTDDDDRALKRWRDGLGRDDAAG